MRITRRTLSILAAGVVVLALHGLGAPAPAAANTKQVAIIEDDGHLLVDPMGTLLRFRSLGAEMVRVFVDWAAIAPDPFNTTAPSFDASDPAAYPAGAWDRWDAIDRDAQQLGLSLDFVLTGGSPLWADQPGYPDVVATNPNRAWYPNAKEFGQFVAAVGTRYSGSYQDASGQTLPRVSFWSIWNEPNFGEDLGPQAINGSRTSVAPGMYRGLVDAAWSALQSTHHGHDRIIIGELAARGMSAKGTRRNPQGLPGQFAQTKPLAFIRTMYCVDSHLRPLRGRSAASVGCPTNRSGTRRFRSQNPGLFQASGFSDHPYPQNEPPTKEASRDPDFAAFSELPNLMSELDRIQRAYGSHTKFPIYNDEYGYITDPPNRERLGRPAHGHFVSPNTAAYYINWAEYLSWRTSRIASTMQYLLYDPKPAPNIPQGGFASGLITGSGKLKPAYYAYRMPLYLPVTSTKRGRSLEVWGGVRPAPYASHDTHQAQYVQIEFQRGSRGGWSTVKRLKITSTRGYFDTHIKFSGSGTVRTQWSYPRGDSQLGSGTITSRYQRITVR
jgi:hypothetical protein